MGPVHQFPDLSELRRLRHAAGWSQKKLAQEVRRAGFRLRQSQVSRIEKGDERVRLNYRAAVTAFRLLESEIKFKLKGDARLASEVMTPIAKLLKASRTDRVGEIIPQMKEREISQIPVMSGGRVLGTLTERGLLGVSLEKLIGDCMDEPPPKRPASTPVRELLPLLKIYQVVLLEEQGELVGIMTAQDALLG